MIEWGRKEEEEEAKDDFSPSEEEEEEKEEEGFPPFRGLTFSILDGAEADHHSSGEGGGGRDRCLHARKWSENGKEKEDEKRRKRRRDSP